MDIKDYMQKMNNYLENLTEYLDKEDDYQENFKNIENFPKIILDQGDTYLITELLILISKISNNHFRSSNFFSKIEKILSLFSDKIKQTLSNIEIFKIFQHNKRILLFLYEESLITFDQSLVDEMIHPKFSTSGLIQFFYHEIKTFLPDQKIEKNESEINSYETDEFEEKRKQGENDRHICQLIRSDSIDEFVVYMNQTNYSINNSIQKSIFETNEFLLENTPSLIEYSAFFGSIQIFNYLYLNEAVLTPSIWLYAVHGRNPEMIHFLEDKKDIITEITYAECFTESIKCFHNEIANYIRDNLLDDSSINDYNHYDFIFRYHNYLFFPENISNSSIAFYYLCKYNYIYLVKKVLMLNQVNTGELIIQTKF